MSELDLHREELAAQNEELRRANIELSAARARLALLFDTAPVGYVALDAGGVITEANLELARMLGRGRDELMGTSFDTFVTHGERQAFRVFRERLLTAEGRRWHEMSLTGEAGALFARVQAATLPSFAPSQAQCILCVSDETERRRVEEGRRAITAKIAEVARLESLKVMAGGIAHDFNNLLSIVLWQIGFAKHELNERSSAQEPLDEARSAAQRAATLARQMLAYAGHAKVEARPLDLSSVIFEIQSLLRSTVASRANLVFELADGLPAVLGDASELQQVVMNLVLNAAEAIGDRGGSIVVRTGHAPPAQPSSRPGTVVLSVMDDGPGMDEATRGRAFDPFFSTKFAGRGLGLAVVLGNVRAHGGTVELASHQASGTTFRVRLPAVSVAVDRRRSPAPLGGWRGEGLVLVVDDEPALRDSLAQLLPHLGFTVALAGDGRAALERLESSSERVVAVLLDMTMPGLDGHATLDAIRARHGALPVIIMSGYAPREGPSAAGGRPDAYLTKPFTMNELGAALRKVVSAPS